MVRNILFVGAHPDDIEFGCGGTLSKHVGVGDSVYCIVMTNGERGNHDLEKKECVESLGSLGVKEIFFGNFPDGNLSHNQESVNFIESVIKKFNIHRVYTHEFDDRHQDHRNCNLATSSAARNVKEILFFQAPSTKKFEPHYIIRLSEENVEKKLNALGNYKSQSCKNYFDVEKVRKLAELTGAQYDSDYAEAFAINHLFLEDEKF